MILIVIIILLKQLYIFKHILLTTDSMQKCMFNGVTERQEKASESRDDKRGIRTPALSDWILIPAP
jgi:hypothetical protein